MALCDVIATAVVFCAPSPQAADPSSVAFFRTTVGLIQRESLRWCQHLLPSYLDLNGNPSAKLKRLLSLLFFLESSKSYILHKDPMFNHYYHLVSNKVPLEEDTLLGILTLALHPPLPAFCLRTVDTLDLLYHLTQRAAHLHGDLGNGLVISNELVPDAILKLALYKPPLPEDSIPPSPHQFAVSVWFWKAATIVCILAACNPRTLGAQIWLRYPTVRLLMEMALTLCFAFPPIPDEGDLAVQVFDYAF